MIESIINDQADAAVILCDSDGIITHANEACERIFGYTPSELLGETIEILVPDEIKDKHISFRFDYMKAPVSRQRGERMGLRTQRKDGTIAEVDVALSPVCNVKGNVSVIAVIRKMLSVEDIMGSLRNNLERLEEIKRLSNGS